MQQHPIETAPRSPLDFLGHGPSVLLLRNPGDLEPVEGWWSERKGWRNGRGRLPFDPKFWCHIPAPSNALDTMQTERLAKVRYG